MTTYYQQQQHYPDPHDYQSEDDDGWGADEFDGDEDYQNAPDADEFQNNNQDAFPPPPPPTLDYLSQTNDDIYDMPDPEELANAIPPPRQPKPTPQQSRPPLWQAQRPVEPPPSSQQPDWQQDLIQKQLQHRQQQDVQRNSVKATKSMFEQPQPTTNTDSPMHQGRLKPPLPAGNKPRSNQFNTDNNNNNNTPQFNPKIPPSQQHQQQWRPPPQQQRPPFEQQRPPPQQQRSPPQQQRPPPQQQRPPAQQQRPPPRQQRPPIQQQRPPPQHLRPQPQEPQELYEVTDEISNGQGYNSPRLASAPGPRQGSPPTVDSTYEVTNGSGPLHAPGKPIGGKQFMNQLNNLKLKKSFSGESQSPLLVQRQRPPSPPPQDMYEVPEGNQRTAATDTPPSLPARPSNLGVNPQTPLVQEEQYEVCNTSVSPTLPPPFHSHKPASRNNSDKSQSSVSSFDHSPRASLRDRPLPDPTTGEMQEEYEVVSHSQTTRPQLPPNRNSKQSPISPPSPRVPQPKQSPPVLSDEDDYFDPDEHGTLQAPRLPDREEAPKRIPPTEENRNRAPPSPYMPSSGLRLPGQTNTLPPKLTGSVCSKRMSLTNSWLEGLERLTDRRGSADISHRSLSESSNDGEKGPSLPQRPTPTDTPTTEAPHHGRQQHRASEPTIPNITRPSQLRRSATTEAAVPPHLPPPTMIPPNPFPRPPTVAEITPSVPRQPFAAPARDPIVLPSQPRRATTPEPPAQAVKPFSAQPSLKKDKRPPPHPLAKFTWYKPDMDRKACEAKLMVNKRNGDFIVRDSTNGVCPYSISIFHDGSVRNLQLKIRDGKTHLGSSEQGFGGVPEMISFHQKNEITLNTGGKAKVKLIKN